jgi:hypothetical protein
MDLARIDDQYVASAGLELLAVDGPQAATFPHELDFIVRMTMGSGAATGESAQQEDGDVHVAVVGPDELVGASLKWQVFLTNPVHCGRPPADGFQIM